MADPFQTSGHTALRRITVVSDAHHFPLPAFFTKQGLPEILDKWLLSPIHPIRDVGRMATFANLPYSPGSPNWRCWMNSCSHRFANLLD